MKNKNTVIVIGLIALVLIIGATMLVLNQDSPTGAVIYQPTKIDLAINPVPNSALIFIAEEKGFFEEQGLDINYHNFPTGKLALDALIGGGADFATTADVPIALAGLANQDIAVLATIEYSLDNIQVVARKDSGVRKPSDLIGKKIATTKGGGPLFFTHQFLKRHNIDVDDVELTYLKPSDMFVALERKDVDAFIVFEPSPSIAKREIGSNNLVIFAPDDLYGETWNLVVTQSYEEDNADKINSFLRALVKAEKYLSENKEESLEIVSKYSEVDENLLKSIMQKQNYGVVLNDLIIEYPEKEAEWAINSGISTGKIVPDYEKLISKEYLEEIKPSAVTI